MRIILAWFGLPSLGYAVGFERSQLMKSRAMVLEAPRKMSLRTFEMPDIGPEDALLKVKMVGVCGSDPGIYQGKKSRQPRPYPIIMGHEMVGEIAKIGDKAAKYHKVRKGARVIVEYACPCGHCRDSLEGNYTRCESALCYGSESSLPGAPPPRAAPSPYTRMLPTPRG